MPASENSQLTCCNRTLTTIEAEANRVRWGFERSSSKAGLRPVSLGIATREERKVSCVSALMITNVLVARVSSLRWFGGNRILLVHPVVIEGQNSDSE